MAEEELPAAVRRLWRLADDGRLGRRPELDVDRVVRTAVELADRDGLNGVTLAKVAAPLGVTAMSLYRYVGSKDELFVLMGDFAVGPAPEATGEAEGWRNGLQGWALALRECLARRPWLVDLPLHGPPRGPHAVAWMEAALRALRDTGLSGEAKLGIQTMLAGFVHRSAQMSRQFAEGRVGTGMDQEQAERQYARLMAKLVDPERWPETARLFATDPFGSTAAPAEQDTAPTGGAAAQTASTGDPDFDFGLQVILDGIAAVIGNARPADPG
jgi:AcrR family transcriptional regulator